MSSKSGDYEVGRGRPPKEHQQKAGQPSKGPNGRRGNKREPDMGASSPPPDWRDRLADAIIEEALMPLDDKRRKQPPKNVLQAYARSMMNMGVTAPSAAAQNNNFEALKWAFAHKDAGMKAWADMLVARQSTIDPDDLWPLKPTVTLPDGKDVIANRITGEFRVEGPMNAQQYERALQALERRNVAAASLDLAYQKLFDTTEDEEREPLWEELEQHRETYLHFNAMVRRGDRVAPEQLLAWYPDKATYEARKRLTDQYPDDF